MWPSSRLLDLLELDVPIIQAPMAGAQLSAMAIAVSQAGGLGSLPCAMLSPDQARREMETIRSATAKPYNVNFFCHRTPAPAPEREAHWRQRLAPYYTEMGLDPAALVHAASRAPFDEAMCAVVEDLAPAVVSFHFGLPNEPLLARVKKAGALVLASATTVEEATWLAARGCDAIIAQGLEAGGHRGLFLTGDLATQLPTIALVPLIVDAVSVPVIASGGIMDSRGIAAAFALGADGVQMGTAYLFCPEAAISSAHREALHRGSTSTVVTNVFSGRPARGIVNRVIRELGPLATDTPAFPHASTPLAPLRAAAEKRGSGDFSPLWAGQSYSLGRDMSAGELTRTLATETLARLTVIAKATGGIAPAYSRADVERSGMTPVALTARWIAASRAVESERGDALFRDPLARDLAGSEGFAFRKAMGSGMSMPDDRDPHLAIRTRFFDDALMQWARAHPSPQIVMLAAGMDSRAFRLDWPHGTVLFEVDRPEVFDYKEPILARLGATPRCDRRIVRADLAGDWTPALLETGFDPTRVAAVSAEGLVMYLEEADAIRLFQTLGRLLPPESWLGLDFVNKEMLTSPYTAGLIQLLQKLGCPWHFGIANPESFFEQYGWNATLTMPGDPEASYGIWPFPAIPRHFPNVPRSFFAHAERTGPVATASSPTTEP
jgi:nitronate monooxygenase